MILRGFTFFPYCDIGGGQWKISNESDKHRGSNHFFLKKKKEKEMKICFWMLL